MSLIARIIFATGLVFLAATHSAPTFAANDGADGGNDLEITGLIIDRTITKGGHDFHDLVVGYLGLDYESPYTLTVLETAGTGRSTVVAVLIDDTVVFKSRLNPLPEKVEYLAQSAADEVIQAIAARRTTLRELEYY
jgi:hypothetical protein